MILIKHLTDCQCIECPSDWLSFGDYCYKRTSTGTYDSSAAECRDMGGLVAVPHSAQENEFLVNIGDGEQVWINCNDKENEGAYPFLDCISETLKQ